MSHIPPMLAKRAGQVHNSQSLAGWPPLTETRRQRMPAFLPDSRATRPRRQTQVNWAAAAGIALAGAMFAASVYGLVWAFALLEAVLR